NVTWPGDRTRPGRGVGSGSGTLLSGGSRRSTSGSRAASVPQGPGGAAAGAAPGTVAGGRSLTPGTSNSSSESLRSNRGAGPSGRGESPAALAASGSGTTTWPEQVGQRTTVPALRRAMPINWLQYAQRNRIGTAPPRQRLGGWVVRWLGSGGN